MTGPASSARRGTRLRVALAALGLAGAVALPVGVAAPAQAAGTPGYCPDSTGVTVVVDFQALGGGVVVRCAPAPLPGSGTGLDALVAAGIPLEGVRRWGDSFICRLDGKPAATTSLAVTGKPDYREQCLDTPPAAAFWGYWHATNGGSWQYSTLGVKGHRAVAGGFEGWSFSLNAGGSGNPVPRLTPTRPAAPATTGGGAGSGAGTGGSGSAGGGSGSAAGGSGSAAGGSGSAAGGSGSTPAPRASIPGASASPGGGSGVGTPAPGGQGATTTPGPSPTTTASGTGTAGASPTTGPTPPPTVSGELASAPATASSGTSTSTVVGVGVLAFLVVVGAGTAWRRRRGADSA